MSSNGSIGSMASSSDQNRGQNALQRRALQLKRWHELMSEEKDAINVNNKNCRVKFSSATLFLCSVAQNDFQECEKLLKQFSHDLDVNSTTGDGLTALHQMSIDDNEEMCRWLLDHNANVNCRDNEGWTPLHAAASCGHTEIVRLLLSRDDCDVFAINCDGELARDVCDGDECLQLIDDRMRRQLDCDDTDDTISEDILQDMRNKELKQIESDFKEFLQKTRLLNENSVKEWIERTRDPISGATVIHVCSAKGYNDILVSILETIGDRLSLDSLLDLDGFTALHSAAFWRQISTFETLLKFGANFELKTRDSRVVADLCHENPKIMELMSETKKCRELEAINDRTTTVLTTAETQRKLNAKRQRETRRPTQGVTKEDIELALKTTSVSDNESTTELATDLTTDMTTSDDTVVSNPPPMPSSPPPVVSLTIPSVNIVSTTVSVPLYPQRRRQKRRSTGIDSNEVLTSGGQSFESEDCVDSQKTILSTTTPSSVTSSVTTSPQSRSRSSSRTSLGQTTDDDKSDTIDDKRATDDDNLDYKKLYKELLKENEFLIRKIKEIEIQRKSEKEFQEFQREKRQLLRRIGELEEELKQKEDLLKENARLKDENSALIRVISKLSK